MIKISTVFWQCHIPPPCSQDFQAFFLYAGLGDPVEKYLIFWYIMGTIPIPWKFTGFTRAIYTGNIRFPGGYIRKIKKGIFLKLTGLYSLTGQLLSYHIMSWNLQKSQTSLPSEGVRDMLSPVRSHPVRRPLAL